MFNAALYSYILAQVLGMYLIIMSFVLLSRAGYYRRVVNKMEAESDEISITASFGLMFGLFLIVIHNIWVWEPRLVVTIVSWVILIKSILWLATPEHMLDWTKRLFRGPGYYVMTIILLIGGIILMSKGFYTFMT